MILTAFVISVDPKTRKLKPQPCQYHTTPFNEKIGTLYRRRPPYVRASACGHADRAVKIMREVECLNVDSSGAVH